MLCHFPCLPLTPLDARLLSHLLTWGQGLISKMWTPESPGMKCTYVSSRHFYLRVPGNGCYRWAERKGWETVFCGVEPLTSHSETSFILTADRAWKSFPFWYKSTPVPNHAHTIPEEQVKGLLSLTVLTVGCQSTAGSLIKSSEMMFVVLYNYCDTNFSLLVPGW